MSGIQGAHPSPPPSQALGAAAPGRIDPRLAGVVRHAAIATPRLSADLSAAPHIPDKPLEARRASVVALNPASKG